MKRFLLLVVVGLVLAAASCAHHRQPRSSAVIIPEGEPNPHIESRVEHAGETMRTVR